MTSLDTPRIILARASGQEPTLVLLKWLEVNTQIRNYECKQYCVQMRHFGYWESVLLPCLDRCTHSQEEVITKYIPEHAIRYISFSQQPFHLRLTLNLVPFCRRGVGSETQLGLNI